MKRLTILSVLLLIAGAFIMFPGCEPSAPEGTLPSVLVITTTGVGSAAHAWSSVLGDEFMHVGYIPVRIVPHATDVAAYTALRDGDAHLRCASAINGWAPAFALEDFKAWGPQPIYLVWQGSLLGTGAAVKGNDDSINKMSDLRGKRVNNVPGMASINIGRDAHLAFGGLTSKDVVLIDCPSYAATMDALKLGRTDCAMPIATTAAGAMDIAAAAGGIKWIPMPASDTAGWERLSKVGPYVPNKVSRGAGIDPAKPLELSGLPNNTFSFGTKYVTEQVAYLWAKTIHTRYENFKAKHPDLLGFTIENALNFQFVPYPYHPGTIKYFKEIGVWTKEHQSWQDKIMADMEARLKAAR